MDPNDIEFVLAVLRAVAKYEAHDEIWWRVDDGLIRFFVNCNDFFYWACADAEPLTPESLPVFIQACEDEMVANSFDHSCCAGPLLFCARMRKMRPQGAFYSALEPAVWPLFDACGPVREPEFLIPKAQPTEVTDGK